MMSLMLDMAPRSIQSTATAFTMFIINVLVIGTGTFAIGFVADALETQGFAKPLTAALMGADAITLLALFFYLRLHLATQGSRPANSIKGEAS
jgi:hypothetical protein